MGTEAAISAASAFDLKNRLAGKYLGKARVTLYWQTVLHDLIHREAGSGTGVASPPFRP